MIFIYLFNDKLKIFLINDFIGKNNSMLLLFVVICGGLPICKDKEMISGLKKMYLKTCNR